MGVMQNIPARLYGLLFFLIFVCLVRISAYADGPAALAGVGARPLTDTLAATWFIDRVVPDQEYRMAIVVFLRGAPGWTNKKADWKWGTDEPAYSSFTIDGHTFTGES